MEKERQKEIKSSTSSGRRSLPYQYRPVVKNETNQNQRNNINSKYNSNTKYNINDSKYNKRYNINDPKNATSTTTTNRRYNNNDTKTNTNTTTTTNRRYNNNDTKTNTNTTTTNRRYNNNDTKTNTNTNTTTNRRYNNNDAKTNTNTTTTNRRYNNIDTKYNSNTNTNKDKKDNTNDSKSNSNKNYSYSRRTEKPTIDTNKNNVIERKPSKSPDVSIYKKDYLTQINNLQNNSFNYQEEKLGENILEISKKNKNIISYIDIDLFLQRIAQEKKIYDDMNDNDTLLNGFCIQHPIFISTNTLISKIISCFNYFYTRYLNQENENNNNKEQKNQSNNNRRSAGGYRNRYKQVRQEVKKPEKDKYEDLVFVKNVKKIPYNLIDLLILFVDLTEKYSKELLTREIIEKIESFYKNILDISDVNNRYKDDIEYSMKILKGIKSAAILRRAKTQRTKLEFDDIFNTKGFLANKIRDPDKPLSFFNILDYDSKDIAKELTRISYKLFSKIQPKEFFKGVFTKKNKDVTSPNITEVANRFNQLSFWIIEEILSYDHTNVRAEIIEKFIDIGNELIKLNNFTDCMSITSALGQVIVTGLTKTWKSVSKESNLVLQDLKNTLNFQDNYKNIREKIDECLEKNEPYIPFLGPYNKRICFLEEYGPYVKEESLINVDKIVLVQQILDQFYKFRSKQYDIMRRSKNEFVIFQCLDPASEEELDKLASFLEPNFVLNNKKSNQKRPTNTENNLRENYEKKEDII